MNKQKLSEVAVALKKEGYLIPNDNSADIVKFTDKLGLKGIAFVKFDENGKLWRDENDNPSIIFVQVDENGDVVSVLDMQEDEKLGKVLSIDELEKRLKECGYLPLKKESDLDKDTLNLVNFNKIMGFRDKVFVKYDQNGNVLKSIEGTPYYLLVQYDENGTVTFITDGQHAQKTGLWYKGKTPGEIAQKMKNHGYAVVRDSADNMVTFNNKYDKYGMLFVKVDENGHVVFDENGDIKFKFLAFIY